MSYDSEDLTPTGALVLLGVAAFMAGGLVVVGSLTVAVATIDRTLALVTQKARHPGG